MKIAEALVRVKDMKGKLTELRKKIDEDKAFELIDQKQAIPSIEDVIDDFLRISLDLANLKTRIVKTNASHGLTDKIHRMERLRSICSELTQLSYNKQEVVNLRSVGYDSPAVQLTTFATYDVEKLTTKIELFKTQIRELDLELQRLNWEIDLDE